jgi:hypothetical protein
MSIWNFFAQDVEITRFVFVSAIIAIERLISQAF